MFTNSVYTCGSINFNFNFQVRLYISFQINIEQLNAQVPVWATYMSDADDPQDIQINRLGEFREGILRVKHLDWPLSSIPRQPIPDEVETPVE